MLAQISDNQYALYEAIDESNAIAERICQQNQSLLLGKVRKMCVDMAAPKESRPNRDGFFAYMELATSSHARRADSSARSKGFHEIEDFMEPGSQFKYG